jgi:hypothetical protein
MRVLWTLVGFAAATLLAAADEPNPALKTFRSEDGNFTVLLPGTPRAERVPIADPKGEPAEQTQFTLDRGNGAYVVSYQDNPNLKDAPKAELEQALTAARAAVQRGFGGQLLSERKLVFYGKYPGLEFEVEVPMGPGLCRARLYLVHGRLHQVIAVGAKEFATAKEVDRVLDSFALLKR